MVVLQVVIFKLLVYFSDNVNDDAKMLIIQLLLKSFMATLMDSPHNYIVNMLNSRKSAGDGNLKVRKFLSGSDWGRKCFFTSQHT